MSDTAGPTAGPGPGGEAAIKISVRAFVTTIAIILALMVGAGILTYIVPAGSYTHTIEAGVDRVQPGSFSYSPRPDYPAWRWLTAPVEVLWSPATSKSSRSSSFSSSSGDRSRSSTRAAFLKSPSLSS